MIGVEKQHDVNEVKLPQTENFRKIKPEGPITGAEAGNFWKGELSGKSVDNPKVYVDDNNTVYRKDDRLEPNIKFEVNGYTYETDKKGRVVSAEGKLRLPPREERNNHKDMDTMEAVGKGYQREGKDHRGHTIGDQFGGSGGIENLTPMSGELNQNDYKNLEATWANKIKEGKQVEVKIQPQYKGDSNRPSTYRVQYSIDGEKNVRVFKNGKEN